MRLYEGRPADARERLEKERRTYHLLDSAIGGPITLRRATLPSAGRSMQCWIR